MLKKFVKDEKIPYRINWHIWGRENFGKVDIVWLLLKIQLDVLLEIHPLNNYLIHHLQTKKAILKRNFINLGKSKCNTSENVISLATFNFNSKFQSGNISIHRSTNNVHVFKKYARYLLTTVFLYAILWL